MRSIRPAVPNDDAVLTRLNRFVQDLHVAHRPDQFKVPVAEELRGWYRLRLSESNTDAWIAEEEQAPVGYVLGTYHQRPANPLAYARSWYEIDQLAVDPAHRRRGVGLALMQQALAAARERGCQSVELSVWAFNDDMHRLIERLGFEPKVGRFELRTGA